MKKEKASEFEDRLREIKQSEEQREKDWSKINIGGLGMHTIRSLEKVEIVIENICRIDGSSYYMWWKTDLRILVYFKVIKRTIPGHIIIKLLKIKDKEKNGRQREQENHYILWENGKNNHWPFMRNHSMISLKSWKKKKSLNQEFYIK